MRARRLCCGSAAALALAFACYAGASRGEDVVESPVQEAPASGAAIVEEPADVIVEFAGAAPAIQLEAAAGAEVDEEALLAPIRAQYEPLLKSELSFASRVCHFTDEQRKQAIAAGVRWLDQFARQQMAGNQGQRGGLVAFFFGAQPQRPADPVLAAESQIADVVGSVLTAEQLGQYASQRAHRTAFARQAIIDNVIAKMDEHLDLSVEQREKLTKTLQARWDENWAPPLETFVHMGQYMPQIPDEYVTPHLSDEQKQIWNGLQKYTLSRENIGNMDAFGGGVGLDDIDLTNVDDKAAE